MKNKLKWKTILRIVGFAAFVAVIGFTMTACEDLLKEEGPSTGFSSWDAFYDWLREQPSNTASNPYPVKLSIKSAEPLKPSGYTWSNNNSQYVKFDISGCTTTSIANAAFYYSSTIVGITIGDSITSIGDEAFVNCYNLTSVTFTPTSKVTSIGSEAFRSTIKLPSVIIPDSVTNIGGGAFSNCYSLTSVTIGNNVTSIGDEAFVNCTSLTSVTIPNSVTSIGKGAFQNCKFTSVNIGNGVTSIGESSFYACPITSLTIPNSVISIGSSAFAHCNNLASLTFAATSKVNTIGANAFNGCRNLTSITIPSSVTSIGKEAFSDSRGVDHSVDFPIGLTSVTFEGTISSSGLWIEPNASSPLTSFPGDLRTKYLAGGIGTYTRTDTNSNTWTKS